MEQELAHLFLVTCLSTEIVQRCTCTHLHFSAASLICVLSSLCVSALVCTCVIQADVGRCPVPAG